jgi:spermidine/putrescine transport system permease protein
MKSGLRVWFVSPAAFIAATLIALPMTIVCAYSLMTRGAYGGVIRPWTVENFARIFDRLYLMILLRSFSLATIATLLCLVLGFPLALYMARAKRRRNLLLNLIMLPFWTSLLIRTYAWMFLLRDTGLVNTVLQALHIVRQPLPLLFNDGAVILGLVYGYLPFMVLPLYATIEKLDPSLLDAAADLGAKPWITVWKVIVPLTRSGVIAGTLLVLVPCLGAYLTPDLLGGGKTVMVGNLVQNQFTTARDWPFGSAVSLLLTGVVLALLAAVLRKREEEVL